jgi:hypothetical protein
MHRRQEGSAMRRRFAAVLLLAFLSTGLGGIPASSGQSSGHPALDGSLPGEAAWVAAGSLPTAGSAWTELTTLPYDLEDPEHANYEDYYGNSGYGLSGGRIEALAVDGDTVYAGAGGGGVWKSPDSGKTWTPVTDDLPSLSSGDLAVDRTNGDVWYGTGDTTMGETPAPGGRSFRGVGVFRSRNGGNTWQLIGGDELNETMIGAIELDGAGNVYAATTNGLYRRSTSASASEAWTLVLRPGTPGPYGFTFANDVVVRPGTDGAEVVASFGWPSADVHYNGLYVSHDHGLAATWEPVATQGDLDTDEIGRASLAYSSDGSRLYAIVGSWHSHGVKDDDRETNLDGVFMSRTGAVAGPWTKIAGARRLRDADGSLTAVNHAFGLPGSGPNFYQAIGVDPTDPRHLYVGLIELYETTDAGRTWVAAGAQFCFIGSLDFCRTTIHGGQHALAFGDDLVYAGTNGGVYRRRLTRHTVGGWANLNGDLHALHYNAVGVGTGRAGDVFWGGTFDDGASLLRPGASTMIATHCCSVLNVIVDPSNPDRAAIVHIDDPLRITTRGGISGSFRDAPPPDWPPYGLAPALRADSADPNRHWVFGFKYVWETTSGWKTHCSRTECDWDRLHNLGDHHMASAIDVSGDTIYAAWCGPVACDPDPEFSSGIDTNVGGEWHRVVGPGIVNGGDPPPNRWISSIAIDPSDPEHVCITYGGYRNTWTFEPEGNGHVFESHDGGGTWTDISGDLPDAAATDLLIVGDRLVLAMDAGVFVADAATPATWSNLGTGMPNAAVTDLALTPDGSSIVAATYGRGLWSIGSP